MGLLQDTGIDTSSEELAKTQQVSAGGCLQAGVYVMGIERAYAMKTEKGALKVSIDFIYPREGEEEMGKYFFHTYIASGDEKGNKSTYTCKKTAKELPLPGLIEFNNLLKSVGIADPKTKDATIEMFNEQVTVKAMPELTGKKVTIGIRNEYDDFKEKDVAFVDTFLDADGKNSDGEDMLEVLTEKIKKTPFKKAKKAKAPATTAPAGGTGSEAAAPGWS